MAAEVYPIMHVSISTPLAKMFPAERLNAIRLWVFFGVFHKILRILRQTFSFIPACRTKICDLYWGNPTPAHPLSPGTGVAVPALRRQVGRLGPGSGVVRADGAAPAVSSPRHRGAQGGHPCPQIRPSLCEGSSTCTEIISCLLLCDFMYFLADM